MKRTYFTIVAILTLALAASVFAQSASNRAIHHAQGAFDIKMTPMPADDYADGKALGRVAADKQYHGDLEGSGKGQMPTATGEVKGSAVYVATERVSGTLGGPSGTFLLAHRGVMNRGAQQLDIDVVPDSGTGEIGLGWPGVPLVSAAAQQSDPASLFGPAQSIRIQPVDSTHVRLRLEGHANWIVVSAGFSFPRSPSPDFVPVVATPGRNTITTPGVSAAHEHFELSIGRSGSLGFSLSSGPKTRENYPASDQTIRIEPVDATHVRLRLIGRENWTVDSAGFSLLPNVDFVRVVAAPGRNAVTAAGASRIAETFELSITPSGSLRFQSTR